MTYTIATAALALGKSHDGIRFLIRTGKLKATKIIDANGRGAWSITQDAIDQYQNGGKANV